MKTRSEERRGGGEAFAQSVDLGGGHSRDLHQPLRIVHQSAEHHGDALGGERVHGAQQPGKRAIDPVEVHGVADLVQHRLGPLGVRLDVAEDPHVAGSVDVEAEGVLVLGRAGVEIGAPEYLGHVEAVPGEGFEGQLCEVASGEPLVEVHPGGTRGLLEERVVVVVRSQVAGRAVEPFGEQPVEGGLPIGERPPRGLVDFLERLEQASFVEVVCREGHREVVPVSERARQTIAKPREISDALGRSGTDGLRRFPRLESLARVVAGAEDAAHRVVVDGLAGDDAPVRRERRLDRDLGLDERAAEIIRSLMRHVDVVEDRDLASGEPVDVGDLARGADRREAVAVG